jgi:hypothetical protein
MDWNVIITAAAVLGAGATIMRYYNKAYNLVQHQAEQDAKIAELKKQHEADAQAVRAEQTLITYGVLACLKGLREQGCDGAVTDAIDKFEKFLNQAAHGQL